MGNNAENGFSLQEKVAVVTGADKNLGAVVVKELTKSGAIVVGTGDSHTSPWQTAKNEFYLRCNRSNITLFELLCQDKFKQYGTLSILANIAEIEIPIKNHDSSETVVDRFSFTEAIESNLELAVNSSKAVAKYFPKSGGGSIINIISIKNAVGFPEDFSYIATKNALLIQTKKLVANLNLIPRNIRVNNIVIGYAPCSDINKSDCDFSRDRSEQDLIKTIIRLASDNSSSIAGQDIFIIGDKLYRQA